MPPVLANRELDELEREDFTRLKMVKKKKEQQIKLDEAAKLKRTQDELAAATLRDDTEENSPGSERTPTSQSASETTEGRDEQGVPLRPKHPKITEYKSKRRDSTPGGVVRSPTSKGTVTSSARQPGMEDLEEDNDVVFK